MKATTIYYDVCTKNNLDGTEGYVNIGKSDSRGAYRIEITINHTLPPVYGANVNSWSGFNNMRELFAYIEGYVAGAN